MNVRLRMYKYCYSNLGAIYAKGLFMCMNVYPFSALSPVSCKEIIFVVCFNFFPCEI